jgi:Ni/Fe-hydrogenase 1 B-type cytochrome subunit
MHRILGPMYLLFSTQGMHLVHHLSMWMIFGFIINHIYSAWLMDIKEHGSEISSMFSGYKFTVKKEK